MTLEPRILEERRRELLGPGHEGPVVALVGNPNVGKSTLFNHLTGQDVATAHYPGKTVEINIGPTEVGGHTLTVLDLPGTYAIVGPGEEPWVTRRTLADLRPEVVVVVLDSGNLARNLVLALQVLDLGLPTVLMANLSDEAQRAGLAVDTVRLGERLSVPVFETVATTGIGVAELMEYVASVARGAVRPAKPSHTYGDVLESTVRAVASAAAVVPHETGMDPRAAAIRLLETAPDSPQRGVWPPTLLRVVDEARSSLEARTGERTVTVLARERRTLAEEIARATTVEARPRDHAVGWRLAALATRPLTGVAMLVLSLLGVFGLLFFVGDGLASLVAAAWGSFVSPVVQGAVRGLFGESLLAHALIWGLDAGLEAALSIGLPYILTFYFLLSVLEDSGYLNAVAFMSDRAMHHLGLHGRATIPLVAGLGCSVPAILGTRVLSTDRERFIASTLISMVPCSARTAVILGAVGHYIGWVPAAGVFAVAFVVSAAIGVVLDLLVPGRTSGLVMEMFPFRKPSLRLVARKAWMQFREFLLVATPLVVVGSMVLGALYESGNLVRLTAPLDPVVVGWLGLPSIAGVTLLFGLIRKEFALQLLVTVALVSVGPAARDLSTFMTPTNLFVYALVNTLAMPCISTMAVLGKTIGWRRALGVMGITVGVALAVGGLFARLLPAIGSVLS
ncbi:MAG: ferrous iron transport protein B [Actinomycetota bacterium]|nr:ferrous iron transport protein B [Actinomycetota bacterium]